MKSNIKTVLLLIIFALILSLPILQAGFLGSDDAADSSTLGAVQALHGNIFQYTLANDLRVSLGQGRVYLFGFMSLPLYYYCPNPLACQAIRLVFIWASPAFFVQNAQISLQPFLLTPDSPVLNLKRSPTFFLLTQHVPFTTDGTVTVGEISALRYQTVHSQSRLSGITIKHVRVFSSFDRVNKIVDLPGAQQIQVSWQCTPHWVVPCFTEIHHE